MLKIIKISIILFLFLNVFSFFVIAAAAEDTAPAQQKNTGLLPDKQGGQGGTDVCPKDSNGDPVNCGNYSLNDMTSVAVKIANLILSLVGSLSLLAFVAGGLMMMLSGGNPEWVTRGKQTLIGAVIGLAIVFTSYIIIQLVYTSLGIKATEKGAWSTFTGTTNDWFK